MIYHKITAFFGLQNRLFQDYLQQLLVLFFVAYVLCACKKELHSAVWIIFDFVNADNPMLRSVGFFQNIQFKIFVSDLGISYSVITRWFSCKNKIKIEFSCKNVSHFASNLLQYTLVQIGNSTFCTSDN